VRLHLVVEGVGVEDGENNQIWLEDVPYPVAENTIFRHVRDVLGYRTNDFLETATC